MGVGNFQIFENALDGAVLAEGPMQRIEGDVRAKAGQGLGDENPPIKTATCLPIEPDPSSKRGYRPFIAA
jgi:hypothetical protein